MRISDWSSDVCSSDLSRLFLRLLPIAVAQQALVELAGVVPRQRLHEVDPPRDLDPRPFLARIGAQFLAERVGGVGHVGGLDDRDHFLPPLLVLADDHPASGYLRLVAEIFLDLLRIDFYPPPA